MCLLQHSVRWFFVQQLLCILFSLSTIGFLRATSNIFFFFFFWPSLTGILVLIRIFILFVQGESVFKWLSRVQHTLEDYFRIYMDTGQSNYSMWGCKRKQEGNSQNLKAARIKMHLSLGPSGDYISDVQWSKTLLCDHLEWGKQLHCAAQQQLNAPPKVRL